MKILCFLTVWLVWLASAPAAPRPPNLVFILTDNQGAWTLGCYGNPDIRTPHIDRLAAEGIRFTHALSSNPVCSPTRATFLTGLIPSQHGVHSFLDPKFMMGPEACNTLQEFTSLGEVLRDAGYTCGLSGKWHLGANMTPSEGFTTWTTKPDGGTLEFYDQKVIEDGQLRVEPGYTTDFWTRKGVEFIAAHKDRSFFLYLAYNGPYSLGKLMLNEAKNRHAAYYADKPLQSFPRDAMHPWQHDNKAFHNTDAARRRMASEVSGVDDGVGEILAALKANDLEENTLVVYTSDQGWMGGQNGMWGMGDHFRPIGAHELMMQIPLIFRQPGTIPPAQTCNALVSNYDFMPSVLRHLGLAGKMPQQPKSPGRDFSPALRGQPLAHWDNTVFYEMETTRAIRSTRWKYVARFPAGPYELYDMQTDPQERFNQYGQPGTEEIKTDLAQQLDAFFNRHADPKYDIWKGGGSKAKRHVP
jgi:arylsulfatase A-like enzyme